MDSVIEKNFYHKHINYIQPCTRLSPQMVSHSVDQNVIARIYNALQYYCRDGQFYDRIETLYYWNNLILTVDEDPKVNKQCDLTFYKFDHIDDKMNLMFRKTINIESSVTRFEPQKEEVQRLVFGIKNYDMNFMVEVLFDKVIDMKKRRNQIRMSRLMKKLTVTSDEMKPIEGVTSISYKLYLYSSDNVKKYLDILNGEQ